MGGGYGVGYGIGFAALAHPIRSPRGRFRSLKESSTLIFSLYMVFCEQVPTTIYNEKSLAVARLSNFGWKMGFEPTTFGLL